MKVIRWIHLFIIVTIICIYFKQTTWHQVERSLCGTQSPGRLFRVEKGCHCLEGGSFQRSAQAALRIIGAVCVCEPTTVSRYQFVYSSIKVILSNRAASRKLLQNPVANICTGCCGQNSRTIIQTGHPGLNSRSNVLEINNAHMWNAGDCCLFFSPFGIGKLVGEPIALFPITNHSSVSGHCRLQQYLRCTTLKVIKNKKCTEWPI